MSWFVVHGTCVLVSRRILVVMVQQRICVTAHAWRAQFALSIEGACNVFQYGRIVMSGVCAFVTALKHEALI